jgi:uncharacterized protein YbaP (TraB family)
MHHLLTLVLVLLTFFIGVGDSLAQRAKGKSRAKAPAVAKQSARHMLFRVQSDSTVVYLMGSVHMLPKSFYPLDTILERSLDSSDVLVLEIKLDPATQMAAAQKMMSAAMLENGETLESVLDKKTYGQLKARLKPLGLDVAQLDPFEPWMVALTLAGLELKSTGFTGELGVDAHFSARASAESKQLEGLETVEDQLALFDSMPIETQRVFLQQTLEGRTQTASVIRRLAEAWRIGDVKSLEKLALSDLRTDSSFYQRMLVDRNRLWMPKIESYLADPSRRYLVVVGAAHLLGPDGILAMLRAKGFEPVQM